jgi:hypothetical protein
LYDDERKKTGKTETQFSYMCEENFPFSCMLRRIGEYRAATSHHEKGVRETHQNILPFWANTTSVEMENSSFGRAGNRQQQQQQQQKN